eukprot:m.10685 g.10685  ORF g.10685 m.10685 type:complete len:418 (-) comp3711_c0_seq1:125-1378(-)
MSSKLPPLTPRTTLRLDSKSSRGKSGSAKLRTVILEDPLTSSQSATLGSFRSSNSSHKDHCMKLLMSGYAEAYAEFFDIVDLDEDGQDFKSSDQLMVLLAGNLSACEDSLSRDDLQTAYQQRQHLAELCIQQSALANAQRHHIQAHAIAKQSKSDALLVDSLGRLANIYRKQERFVDSARACEDRLALLKGIGTFDDKDEITRASHKELAEVLQIIAALHLDDEEYGDHLDVIDRAEASAKLSGDHVLYVNILLECAKAREARGLFTDAIEHYNKYLGKRKEMKSALDGKGQAIACLGLANCYEKEGDIDVAMQYLRQLVSLCDKTGQKEIACYTCSNLGNLLAERGNLDESTQYFEKAMSLAREQDNLTLLNEIQVKAGIARAYTVHPRIVKKLASNTKEDVKQLVDWSLARKMIA